MGLPDRRTEGKGQACKDVSELTALLGEMGVALPDELLDAVAGGDKDFGDSYTPSEKVFYYGVTDPEFPLSEIEGALDEAGTYTLYILPYGDGMPFTYGAWTSEVTE